jgi:hypothetical protein
MTTDASAAPPGASNATLADLAGLLRDQQARKADFVAPAAAIRAEGARLVVEGTAPVLGPDGVTMTTGTYTPTDVCDQGVADKLGIPAGYLRRMREHKPGLYDANVNAWLDGDDRRFLLRCLRPASGEGPGVARAFQRRSHSRVRHTCIRARTSGRCSDLVIGESNGRKGQYCIAPGSRQHFRVRTRNRADGAGI